MIILIIIFKYFTSAPMLMFGEMIMNIAAHLIEQGIEN
jgi:hypothetical protein